MRRLLVSLSAMSLLAMICTGCRSVHGRCDSCDPDHCCVHAPWAQPAPHGMPMPEGEIIPAPKADPKKL